MRLRRILSIAAVSACLGTSAADAAVFLSTGDTGQPVQCDVTDSQWWTYSVDQTVSGLNGGLFSMKDGPNTIADIMFTIIEGDYAAFGQPQTPVVLSTTFSNAGLQGFTWVEFTHPGITLQANRIYTSVLTTTAPNSRKYFVRSGQLVFVDENGNRVLPGVKLTIGAASSDMTIPEPTSLALAGLVPLGLMARWRRP